MSELIGKATVEFGRRAFQGTFNSHLSPLKQKVCKYVGYTANDYMQFGLLFHDTAFETPRVKEALRRLRYQEPEVFFERLHRIGRALEWNLHRYRLPKEQWIPYECEVPYLTPFVRSIDAEKKDRSFYDADEIKSLDFIL